MYAIGGSPDETSTCYKKCCWYGQENADYCKAMGYTEATAVSCFTGPTGCAKK